MIVEKTIEWGVIKLEGAEPRLFEDARRNLREYVTIDYELNAVRIKAKDFVGNIPIHPELVLQVEPRFIGQQWDFIYLVERASKAGVKLPPKLNELAGLSMAPSIASGTLDFIAARVITLISEINRVGILRRTVSQRKSGPQLTGKLLFNETVVRWHSRGRMEMVACDAPQFTPDLPENRLVKGAIRLLLQMALLNKDAKRALRSALHAFDHVRFATPIELEALARIGDWERGLPSSKKSYIELLGLSRLIVTRSTFAFGESQVLGMQGFSLQMSKIFERFVFNELSLLLEAHPVALLGAAIGTSTRALFDSGNDPIIKPDIVILKGGSAIAVLDAKYIPTAPGVEAFFQILSYVVAHGCENGFLVLPSTSDRVPEVFRVQNAIIRVVHVNLNKPETACGQLAQMLVELCTS